MLPMRVFLSYPSEDRKLAEAIYLGLRAQRHRVFFDRADLPPGEEYDVRIRRAIERAHLFVFLLSPESLDPGSYTLTELGLAQKRWDHPAGRVLPVVVRAVGLHQLPSYLKSVTLLQPEGNMAATVVDAVHRAAVGRRRRTLKTLAAAVAALSIISVGAYAYWANRQPAEEVTTADGAPAVLVPAGNFTMGNDEDSPLKQVYVDTFYIDKYEVTVLRYAEFLRTGGSRQPAHWEEANEARGGDLPVIGVNWHDADAYCRWAGKRLPTEAEWEKAARGPDARIYPWGNEEPISARASFGKSSAGPYEGGLAAVGSYDAGKSPYGIYDLAGNAAEWVADWFAESSAHGDVRNPKGPDNGITKVIRGGGWYDPPKRISASWRMHASPDNRADDVGFRCAGNLPQ